jgi:hypothetical protein
MQTVSDDSKPGLYTYIYQVSQIACVKIMDHGSFIQMSELSHVISLVKFGRIDLVDVVGIDLSLLLIC